LKTRKIYQKFFMYENILLRKYQLKNSIKVNQIVLPEDLARTIIKHFHAKDYFQHLGSLKMERHMVSVFYIRNFVKIANEVIQKCIFCSYNKIYPNKKLLPGFKIHIDGPRKFIFMDVCTVRSQSRLDSFF
jgi:hypothetical protein